MLAVTWLNPHVYLDTFVVLGSLGGQLTADVRSWFALGAVSASAVWFFGLALLASWLAPWLNAAGAAHHQRAGRAGDVGHRAAAGLAGANL